MQYQGLGILQNEKEADDYLTKVLEDHKNQIVGSGKWSLESVYEPDNRQGLIYIPSSFNEMTDLALQMDERKPGSFSQPGLNPSFPSSYVDKYESDFNGTLLKESKVSKEKTAVFIRSYLSKFSLEDRKIFDEYERNFTDLQNKCVRAAGFMSEGGTIQETDEAESQAGLTKEHLKEINDIFLKKLKYSSSKLNFINADSELNKQYKILIKKADEIVEENQDLKEKNQEYSSEIMKKAERAWIIYRDSTVKLIEVVYKTDPHKEAVIERYKIDATRKQTKTIEEYLNPNN